MSIRPLVAAVIVVATGAAGALVPLRSSSTSVVHAQVAGPPAPPAHTTSSVDDQVDLSVTVYNSNLALVRDVRQLTLVPGVFNLELQDIAATINPATVHFRSLTDAGRVNVLEQNYEFDLLEPDKLLRKYVGRDVTLVRIRQTGGTTREEEVTARLISYNTAPVWRIGNEIVTGLSADHIRFPELPANLHPKPTLIWSLDNAGPTRQRIETSYLAGGLTWNADYVLTVARDDRTADLDGWVTVTNGSGTSFPDAQLQLVAGDVNRVQQAMNKAILAQSGERAFNAAPMVEESFSDYHLYTVGRKTSINTSETKQISMLTGNALPIQKRYVVDGQSFYYRNAQHPGSPIKDVVQVYYQFANTSRGGGLGMPMPAGVVRVYQADSRGGLQFAGEDRIDHTPKDETVNIKIGNAFDVVAERKQIDFQKIATNVYEIEYEVALRNHKATPVMVEVNEPIGGTWTMVRSTHAWTKTDAFAARFMLPVTPDGDTTLRYRVRVTY